MISHCPYCGKPDWIIYLLSRHRALLTSSSCLLLYFGTRSALVGGLVGIIAGWDYFRGVIEFYN